MVIDSSAIIAILEGEPERRLFIQAIEDADSRRLSVANWVEASIIVDARRGVAGLRDLDRFVSSAGIELVATDVEQGRLAREAFNRFGKGRHPAALNYGDCFAYALATVLGEPLLYKGNDFGFTDLIGVTKRQVRPA